jgi:hypothetical protein
MKKKTDLSPRKNDKQTKDGRGGGNDFVSRADFLSNDAQNVLNEVVLFCPSFRFIFEIFLGANPCYFLAEIRNGIVSFSSSVKSKVETIARKESL